MKKVIIPIAALTLVAFAGSASAQCDFNAVSKAKGLKSSMIRAQAPCGTTDNPPNTETGGGTPACEPVQPLGGPTPYLFNLQGKGSCTIQTSGKIVKDCSTLTAADGVTPLFMPPGPCHVVYVKGGCKGIVQDDGETPINATDDSGWTLATLSRASLNDQTNGDMTVIDFPVSFDYDAPSNGQIKISSNSAISLSQLVGPTAAALPTCTQIEVVDITTKDPDGNPFASLGGGTATKEDLAD